ncbi:MAG: hypothetical protein SOY13_10030 [Pseudoflavonifractor sp.]|nr:hypothetical protein [Pseudoflavonifractor sp.]
MKSDIVTEAEKQQTVFQWAGVASQRVSRAFRTMKFKAGPQSGPERRRSLCGSKGASAPFELL